ncbi:hypothetical protein MKW92_004688 [Papaver armeniacum]|nr:hypothetical protein MKW92_004688 [Papaver armeniacum]
MAPRCFLLIQISCWLSLVSFAAALEGTKQGCQAKCGNITVPYPFGITPGGADDIRGADGCAINGVGYGYSVNCNTSYEPPKLFIGTGNVEVLSISETEMRIKNFVPSVCNSMNGDLGQNHSDVAISFSKTHFTLSDTKNRFFVVGCDTGGIISGYDQLGKPYSSSCQSSCQNMEKVKEGSCNGSGCCQSTIPKRIQNYNTTVTVNSNTTKTSFLSFDPCVFAFVAEYEQFKFSIAYLLAMPDARDIPIVLNWSVGNKTCEEAQKILACLHAKKTVVVAIQPTVLGIIAPALKVTRETLISVLGAKVSASTRRVASTVLAQKAVMAMGEKTGQVALPISSKPKNFQS